MRGHRYASFDYCYNYFRHFYATDNTHHIASDKNLLLSCLQLGFYLASWGMYRGSSKLLRNKDITHYEGLMRTIAGADQKLWKIDVNNYDDPANIKMIVMMRDQIKEMLKTESDTLVSKIILVVFGNVPAFDRYFCLGVFKSYSRKLIPKNLSAIYDIYLKERTTLETLKIMTISYGNETTYPYPIVKKIDMYGFERGVEEDARRKKEKHKQKRKAR